MWHRLTSTAYLAWHMVGQTALPFRPMAAIRRRQGRRVRSMVAHAYRTVPYYRETMDRLGLTPADFRSVEDLARLPILQPGDLQRDPGYYVSRARPLQQYVALRTGGSSGEPRLVWHAPEGVLQNAAHGERDRAPYLRRVGRRFGYRETVVISLNCTAQKFHGVTGGKAILPGRLRIRRQYLSLLAAPEENVPLINEFRPDVLHSYGSYLAMLFGYLADSGAAMHLPKVVTYSSDGLPEPVRRLIESRFGIPVFSTYQANEALKIGFECEAHRGLHLNVDLYPLRVVDASGRDAPPETTGEVVVSNLVNRATVLLNYRLGDLAATLPGACPCGRTLPMLSFPPGRCDDLISMPSGKVVHPQAVRTIFTNEEHVRQYRIVQSAPARFAVEIVVAPRADRAGVEQRVRRGFAERFSPEARVDVAFVDSIDRTATGKFRPVIAQRPGAGAAPAPPGP